MLKLSSRTQLRGNSETSSNRKNSRDCSNQNRWLEARHRSVESFSLQRRLFLSGHCATNIVEVPVPESCTERPLGSLLCGIAQTPNDDPFTDQESHPTPAGLSREETPVPGYCYPAAIARAALTGEGLQHTLRLVNASPHEGSEVSQMARPRQQLPIGYASPDWRHLII
jgi:hypothetical protein